MGLSKSFLLLPGFIGVSVAASVLLKAACILPKNEDHVTRAALLQQCISNNASLGNETVCYKRIGCFSMESPWVNLERPFPSPAPPEDQNVTLFLHTRRGADPHNITLWPEINDKTTYYWPKRTKTVFITHGFSSSSEVDWVGEIKKGYLEQEDANVFLVDWRNGARKVNYLQVASNTRVAGALLASFIKRLIDEKGMDVQNVHLIGHSLGAHISGYAAKIVNTPSRKIARITALDPAQPGFELQSERVRLSKNDADTVDVIHTNAKPFIPFLGFGMISAIGHLDFYMNGGAEQPGCVTKAFDQNITSIIDLAKYPVEVISTLVTCSHTRSAEYFAASLRKTANCSFTGRKMSEAEGLLKWTPLGLLSLPDPIVSDVSRCTPKTCAKIGLNVEKYPRGSYQVKTGSRPPFCPDDTSSTLAPTNVARKLFFTAQASLSVSPA